MDRRNENGKKSNDGKLIAGLIVAGGLIALIVFLMSGKGGAVRVRVDGETVATFPLNGFAEYKIEGVGGTNHLVIKSGKAFIDIADCPDGLCMKMGGISRSGQSIVCLPHKVVVDIVGETDPNDVDVTAR